MGCSFELLVSSAIGIGFGFVALAVYSCKRFEEKKFRSVVDGDVEK